MTAKTRIVRIGNSRGIRIPKSDRDVAESLFLATPARRRRLRKET